MLFVNARLTCSGRLECTERLERSVVSNYALNLTGNGALSCPASATSHTDEFVEIYMVNTPVRVDNTWQRIFTFGSAYLAVSSTNKIRMSSTYMEVRINGVLQSYVNNATDYTGSGLDDLEGKVVNVKLGGANSSTELVVGGDSSYSDNFNMLVSRVVHYDSSQVIVSDWDVNSSTIGVGTVIVTDVISANNASGVNLATDGSNWVDLGSSGSTLALVATGYPDGTYSAELYEATNPLSYIETVNATFSSGSATVNTSATAGQTIYTRIDGATPPTSGVTCYGVAV